MERTGRASPGCATEPVRTTSQIPPGSTAGLARRAGPRWQRPPSGLFPSREKRPVYQEAHPATRGAVALGAAGTTVWMALFGLLGTGARGYVWLTVGAGLLAWVAAVVLVRLGDRGVAAGVALASGIGVSIAGVVVIDYWANGHWLLW